MVFEALAEAEALAKDKDKTKVKVPWKAYESGSFRFKLDPSIYVPYDSLEIA
jgi:hypothetical protein